MIPPPQPFGAPRDPGSGLPVVPLLLTVNQAAELLGMGRSTIYELIDSGELKSVKRGASRRVPLKAVHDYIEHLFSQQNDASNRTPTPSSSHRIVPISAPSTSPTAGPLDVRSTSTPDLRPIQPDSSEPSLPETATMQLVDAVRARRLDPLDAAVAHQVAIAGLPLDRATKRLGLTRAAARQSLRAARDAMETRPTIPLLTPARKEIASAPVDNSPVALPLLLSVHQASHLIGVSRTTLYKLMDTGELFYVHIGASRRVPAARRPRLSHSPLRQAATARQRGHSARAPGGWFGLPARPAPGYGNNRTGEAGL